MDSRWVLASIWATFWHPLNSVSIKFNVLGWSLLRLFLGSAFDQNLLRNLDRAPPLFHPGELPCSWLVSLVRPTSATNYVSQLISTNAKSCSTLAPFTWVRLNKYAMIFLQFYLNKLNVNKKEIRKLQGLILEQLLHRLASFCFPFSSIWVVFGILFDLFWKLQTLKLQCAHVSKKPAG